MIQLVHLPPFSVLVPQDLGSKLKLEVTLMGMGPHLSLKLPHLALTFIHLISMSKFLNPFISFQPLNFLPDQSAQKIIF
jgi:hypothetical protein